MNLAITSSVPALFKTVLVWLFGCHRKPWSVTPPLLSTHRPRLSSFCALQFQLALCLIAGQSPQFFGCSTEFSPRFVSRKPEGRILCRKFYRRDPSCKVSGTRRGIVYRWPNYLSTSSHRPLACMSIFYKHGVHRIGIDCCAFFWEPFHRRCTASHPRTALLWVLTGKRLPHLVGSSLSCCQHLYGTCFA